MLATAGALLPLPVLLRLHDGPERTNERICEELKVASNERLGVPRAGHREGPLPTPALALGGAVSEALGPG